MGRAEDIFDRLIKEGEAAIDEFIVTRQSEELFLEFKRSADDGSGSKLDNKDRQQLADAISGFGNSEGGVLVWGVKCTDVATRKHPLADAPKFASWLEHAISGCTVPPHSTVRNHVIARTKRKNSGFVATLIPKSDYAPHQVTGRNQYYIRVGSSFMPTPHSVLAGMFGRRPQPNVSSRFVIEPANLSPDLQTVWLKLAILLDNKGRGIARDLFLNLQMWRKGSEASEIYFEPNEEMWAAHTELGRLITLISRSSVRLPPEGVLTAATIHVTLRPPVTDSIRIEGNFGCDGAPTRKLKFSATAEQLEQDFETLAIWAKAGELTSERLSRFVERVFGIGEGSAGPVSPSDSKGGSE